MNPTILCHSRGPSRIATLAGVASSAAVVLEFWRNKQKDSPDEVLRLLDLLVLPRDWKSQDPTLIVTLDDAFREWDNHRFNTVRSTGRSLDVILKRLRRAATKRAELRSKEAAALRDFCLALSKQALAHAG